MPKTNYLLFLLCLFFLIFKIISIRLTDLDLFGDEAQYWLWSKNLDFGYYSKPPLLSWTIALVCSFFGNSIFVIKMISINLYCLISYVIFLISKKLLNNNKLAFLSAVTFFLMPAVSISSFIVSTDILLILFWSLALLQILIIKEKPSKINFILLGIFVGLSFLAKYAAIYFMLCIIIMFFEKEMRDIFLKNKISFLYCIIVISLIATPNIIWNFNNGWLTLNHTIDNAALNRTDINIVGGLVFVVSQILMVGPLIFLFFCFGFVKNLKYDFNTKFLIIFSFPIFFIILIESMLVKANANWAAVSLVSFLILFVHTTFKFNRKAIFLNNMVNLVFGLVIFFLISISSSNEPFKRINGITSFANSLFQDNKKSINSLVVSDRILFSNLSYILRNKEIKIYTPFIPSSKISHHFQITNSLSPNFSKNFIFIGQQNQIKYLKTSTLSHFWIPREFSLIMNQ